jgi:hypothetical protein
MGELCECSVGTNTRKDMGGHAELEKTVGRGKETLAMVRIVTILV